MPFSARTAEAMEIRDSIERVFRAYQGNAPNTPIGGDGNMKESDKARFLRYDVLGQLKARLKVVEG